MRNTTVACMATFPERFGSLAAVVTSILDQVDFLYVYVNQSDSIPSCLKHPKVSAFLGSNTAGNLSANGKVFPLQFVENSYVMLIDDDFLFPKDYVERLKETIDVFGRRVCVGVHGTVFAPGARWYYERSTVYDCEAELSEHKLVQMLGSGCLAFHQSGLRLTYEDFLPRVMVDLTIAIKARQQGVPMLAVKRPSKWVRRVGHIGLYESFLYSWTWHTSAMRQHNPWSVEVYLDLVRNFFVAEFGAWDPALARQLEFDREVVEALAGGDLPRSWGRTVAALASRKRFLEVIAVTAGREGGQMRWK